MAITFERLVRFEKNLFNFVFTECFVIYYRKQHYNWIKIKEDMAFENIDYAISRKLVVRSKNCFHQHTVNVVIFAGGKISRNCCQDI